MGLSYNRITPHLQCGDKGAIPFSVHQWGFSDNGSTVALQASGKSSILLTSTKKERIGYDHLWSGE